MITNEASSHSLPLRVSAKADYAVRAAMEVAARGQHRLVKAEEVSRAQSIPLKFLLNILAELRQAGILRSQRGSEGGYELIGSASEVSVAAVIRAVEGSLLSVRSTRPSQLDYNGSAEGLRSIWLAVEESIDRLLEAVSLADLIGGSLRQALNAAANH